MGLENDKGCFLYVVFAFILMGLINEPTITFAILGILLSILVGIIAVKHIKSENNKNKLSYLKSTFPNAYNIFCSDIGFNVFGYNKLEADQLEQLLCYKKKEWETVENKEISRKEKAKLLYIEYHKIKSDYPDGLQCWEQDYPKSSSETIVSNIFEISNFDKNHKDFLLTSDWEKRQDLFRTKCLNQLTIMPHCGYYNYDLSLPKINYKRELIDGKYKVAQLFFTAYCKEDDLDYSYFQDYKINYKNLDDYREGKLILKPYIINEITSFVKSLNPKVSIVILGGEAGENIEMTILSLELYQDGYQDKRWVDIETIENENILIIDIETSIDQFKSNCDFIIEKCKKIKPCITYVSIFKEFSREEMQELIDKKNNEVEQKSIKDQKKEQIKQNVLTIEAAIKSGNIELAEKNIEILTKKFTQDYIVDKELSRTIETLELELKNKYKDGIVDIFGTHYVDYDAPEQFKQGENWEYALAKFPSRGNIVFPYRRRAIARRGYMESTFQSYLQDIFKGELLVIGDCSILPYEYNRPYEPDIAIIDIKRPSIRIDIEIDEPYSAISNKPIHFIGCGDEFRDMNLNNLGWIVLRFSEFQIVSDMMGCATYLLQIIHAINPNLSLAAPFLQYPRPKPVKRWSEIESKIMASEKIREHYLNHEFGIVDSGTLNYKDIIQNNIEKESAKLLRPILFNKTRKQIDKSVNVFFERDIDVQFSALEHIYLYKGNRKLVPVSSVVSYFFKPFESIYWSEQKAKKRGISQGEILEEWDMKGARSREVGTFMHQQIENYYNSLEYKLEYNFKYSGKYLKVEEDFNLEIESGQFYLFRDDHPFTPFRIEWAIYDEDLQIAGTIDMIHEKGDKYDIYDWKRSHRVVGQDNEPISSSYYGEGGIRGLEHIQDTVYWHYCLQQNLYRFILEKNYSIKVDKMYLVIFTDDDYNYKKLEVPYMDDAIKIVINSCKKGNINHFLD